MSNFKRVFLHNKSIKLFNVFYFLQIHKLTYDQSVRDEQNHYKISQLITAKFY